MTTRRLRYALCVLACAGVLASPAAAVPIEVVYQDGTGEGFFDTEIGPARRAAFEFAAGTWAATLAGATPIVVEVRMVSLGGSGASATLASSGAVSTHRNLGYGLPDTWYTAALANQLAGADINGPDLAEITVTFNADVDGPQVLGSVDWYYGLDGQAGVDIDFVTIALHELGHGLGFFEAVDAATGAWTLDNDPTALERMLFRPGVGRMAEMQDSERLAAIVSGNLLWDGPHVVAFNGSGVPMYAPEPFQPGASIAHWDVTLTPDEVIEPFYTGPIHDLGLLLPAMMDMGWQVLAATPTPRASPATPTPTLVRRFTPTPGMVDANERVYVSNFDDATVSVISTSPRRVIATIPVGDGPMGVAAAPDGTRVFVANFHAGTLSVVDTGRNEVAATVAIGGTPHAVAVTPDGAVVVVTDTLGDQLVVVDAAALMVAARLDAGPQPVGVALDADGRLAFVTNFTAPTLTVLDIDAQLRRAIIPINVEGLVSVDIARETNRGAVAAHYSSQVTRVDAATLKIVSRSFLAVTGRPEAVALHRNGTVYVSTSNMLADSDELLVVEGGRLIARIYLDHAPEAMTLSPDDSHLWVVNSGSDTVIVVDTEQNARLGSAIRVGRAPMGVAVAAVPVATPTPVPCPGDCDGGGVVTVDELMLLVRVALRGQPTALCPGADADLNGRITIDEILRAVRRTLDGCSRL